MRVRDAVARWWRGTSHRTSIIVIATGAAALLALTAVVLLSIGKTATLAVVNPTAGTLVVTECLPWDDESAFDAFARHSMIVRVHRGRVTCVVTKDSAAGAYAGCLVARVPRDEHRTLSLRDVSRRISLDDCEAAG
jgi:hypothetical protein